MTITTFSSKPVFRLYRNILRRNLGLCLFYTALSFFFFPLQYILQLITTPEQELADISLFGPLPP